MEISSHNTRRGLGGYAQTHSEINGPRRIYCTFEIGYRSSWVETGRLMIGHHGPQEKQSLTERSPLCANRCPRGVRSATKMGVVL
jgi:hypothetical protein